MTIIADNRKLNSISNEFLPDGYFQIGTNSQNIKESLFFGENVKITKITEYYLATTEEEIFSLAESFVISYLPNTKNLINISGPTEKLYIKETDTVQTYYAFTKEYILLPEIINPPENKRKNAKTQINSDGYTLDGNPIITGGSKGLIFTETYLCKENLIPTQATITDEGTFISSVSKSNKQIINGSIYYDISVTTQEL
jgi:hypothetical protein